MKGPSIILMLLLGITGLGFAQQDPDDPGIQDSIIVGDAVIDSGTSILFVQIFAVTDDSVTFYNVPLRFIVPPGGELYPIARNIFYPPLTSWDDNYETLIANEGYLRQIGFSDLGGDDNPVLLTNGQRVNVWTIPFFYNVGHNQLSIIDTTWDSRNGSLKLGLAGGYYEITPGFRRGIIGMYVGVDNEMSAPTLFSLSQNYPNPFNSSTEVEFALPQNGPVSLVIYDIQGREVRRLLDGDLEAGGHSVIWNSLNDDCQPVSSGIYFYKLVSNNSAQSNRMTLLR